MAKYRITDPQSGRVVTVSGDKPPTQEDATAIFSTVNQSIAPASSEKKGGLLQDIKNVASFIAPQTTKSITQAPGELGAKMDARQKQNPNNVVGNALADTADFAKTIFNPKQVAEAASTVVPLGKGLMAKAGLGALSGGLTGASQEKVTPGSIAKGALAGGVAGPVLSKAGALMKPTQELGKQVTKEGEELILKALKPSASQQRIFKEKTGKPLVDFMRENKLTGDFVKNAENGISDLQKQFDDIAVNSGIKIKTKDVMGKTVNVLDSLMDSLDDADGAKVEKVIGIMDNLEKKYGKTIDIGDLTKERRFFDKKVKDFGADMVNAGPYKLVRDAFTDAIQDGADKAGRGGLKELGLKLRDYKTFQKIAAQQEGLGKGANILGIIPSLLAGAGGVVGGLPGVAAGIGISKATQNPRVINAGSKLVEKAGQGIQKAGEKTETVLRMEAMQRLMRGLSSQGASK